MKKALIIFLFISSVIAQNDNLKKSLYLGLGMGINIGGSFGIGFEHELKKKISLNFSIGSLPSGELAENSRYSNIGFDLGIKYYVLSNLFIGANYGLVDYRENTLFKL